MDRSGEDPCCSHRLYQRDELDGVVATQLCLCPAGMVHMHDCPMTMGLECAHFEQRTEPPGASEALEMERIHDRLMEDYLTPAYRIRVRSLAPGESAYQRRKRELEEAFLDAASRSGEDPAEDVAAYEAERDRLIELRKQREEVRARQEERSREQRARERARMGIKTVVEKARDAVALKGNVNTSRVDDVELPAKPPRPTRRRHRRRRRTGGPGPRPDVAPASGEAKPRRRRRRRRRKPHNPPGS